MVLHRPVELAPFLRRYPVQMWDYFLLGRDPGLSRPNTADLAGAAWAFLAVQFCYPWYCSWPSFFCSGLRLEAIALDVSSGLGFVTRNTGVVIVDINDHDYKDLFQGQSPLNPAILIELVDAIAKAKPKAIGVDIVTDPAVWTTIQAPSNIPIVWAYRPDNPEGKSLPPTDTAWGSPKWPTNGPVVRQYLRLVPCQDNQYPSLAWEIMKKGFP